MERFLVIIVAATIGTGVYYWFTQMVKKESMRQFIMDHLWLLHPNSICYWRGAMAIIGFFMYFFTSSPAIQSMAIIIFTFAAMLNYRHEQRLIFTDDPVQISGEAANLKGDTLRYDLNAGKVVLTGNVAAALNPGFEAVQGLRKP